MSNKRRSAIFLPGYHALWEMLTLTIGFTAILCWWVAIVGIANTRSAGSAIFLLVPALATAATLVALHRASRSRATCSLL